MTYLGYEFYNDVGMLPTYAILAISYFLLLFGTIILHEIGHWLYFKKIGKKMKINFIYDSMLSMRFETGDIEDYKNLSDNDYLYSLWSGVLVGLIPIIMSGCFFFPSILMIIPYGVGCISDLKEINKVYTSMDKNFLDLEDD